MDFNSWIWCIRSKLCRRAEIFSQNEDRMKGYERHYIDLSSPVAQEKVDKRAEIAEKRKAKEKQLALEREKQKPTNVVPPLRVRKPRK